MMNRLTHRPFSKRQLFGALIAFLVLIAIFWVALQIRGERSLSWTEDVKLPDGRIIVVTRFQKFRDANHDPGDYWMEFVNPDNNEKVRWESDRDLAPVALLLSEKTPFLIMKPKWGSSYHRFNCPNPVYLLFNYSGSKWERLPLERIPRIEIRANVIYSVYDYLGTIKRYSNRLPVEITQAQQIDARAWVMDFANLGVQEFGKNCSGVGSYLLKN